MFCSVLPISLPHRLVHLQVWFLQSFSTNPGHMCDWLYWSLVSYLTASPLIGLWVYHAVHFEPPALPSHLEGAVHPPPASKPHERNGPKANSGTGAGGGSGAGAAQSGAGSGRGGATELQALPSIGSLPSWRSSVHPFLTYGEDFLSPAQRLKCAVVFVLTFLPRVVFMTSCVIVVIIISRLSLLGTCSSSPTGF